MKYNIMGSEVEEGFKCKPKVLNPNKPIMHFKTHIFICNGERCKKAHKNRDLANQLREILKEMHLAKGEKRIKISKSDCFGACRFRSVATIYENTKRNGDIKNNNLWLKNIHLYNQEKWKRLFLALSNSKNIDELDFQQIEMMEEA